MIAPAKTGKANKSNNVVIRIDKLNKVILLIKLFLFLAKRIEEIKLIELTIEDKPAICKEKIIISMEEDIKYWIEVKGGYIVQPTPFNTPFKVEEIINIKEGKSIQNLMLFNRGNDKSEVLIIKGINQFPNPPIIAGITIKKIIIIAWTVTIEL